MSITNAAEGLEHLRCKRDCSDPDCYDSETMIAEALERSKSVEILDTWEDGAEGRKVEQPFRVKGSPASQAFCCALEGSRPGCTYRFTYRGATRDAARAAAAEAIVSSNGDLR